jgi:hypothetical protein
MWFSFCRKGSFLYSDRFAITHDLEQNCAVMTNLNTEKRKLPRFHITPCQFLDARLNKSFSIQDISMGGLSLRLVDRNDLPDFYVGTEHKGNVKVEGLKTECMFRVRSIRGTLIGAEWVNPSKLLTDHLNQISHPEILGEHLKLYDLPDISNAFWYHNPVGVDLLFYKASGEGATSQGINRWTLYIHHTFVQWDIETGLTTGKSVAEDEEGYAHGIVRLETRLIEYDPHPARKLVETAIAMIEHATLTQHTDLRVMALNHLKGI